MTSPPTSPAPAAAPTPPTPRATRRRVKRSTLWWALGIGAVVVALMVVYVATDYGGQGNTLRNQTLVVHFDANATQQQQLAARRACSDLPATPPENVDINQFLSGAKLTVEFNLAHADARDLAKLTVCLQKQPGVNGYELPDD